MGHQTKQGPNPILLRWQQLAVACSTETVETFKKFGYILIWNNNVIHERGRPTEKWDLIMIIFVEHICKLTIKFISLLNFWSCDTSSSSSFKGQNTLIVFFSYYWCTDRSLEDLP